MYSQCVSERSATQQRRFEAAMLELMKDRLFEEISISELCRYSGLSRKTFYRLYEAKADVIYGMIDHALLDFESFTENSLSGSGPAEQEMERMFSYWFHQRRLLDALQKSGLSGVLVNRAIGHLQKSIEYIQGNTSPATICGYLVWALR